MNLPSDLKKFSSKQLVSIQSFGFFILMACFPAQSSTYENLVSLRQKAETFLGEEYSSEKNERMVINMGYWDKRLLLSACQQPITFKLQDTAAPGGSVTVNCHCPDSPGWSIHLSAQVDIYRPVAIAKHNISRGNLITLTDLDYETRNISQISEQSFADANLAKGLAAKRMITKGDVIRPSMLDQPRQVRRGEQVTITSHAGSISVVMQGTAMNDGKLGQRIRVRNDQSERIISAKVVGPAQVETI